ncbi:MAG: class I SAM-dependent methyltransferase [Thermoplasmata archaeon]|nr:class I SAM-dependent methyltransferase [Thermoplasmata archaeon]
MQGKLIDTNLFDLVEKEIGTDSYFPKYYKEIEWKTQLKYVSDASDFVEPYGRILSVGCGFGVNEILMKEMNSEIEDIVGVDVVPSKVQYMRKIVKKIGLDNIESIHADGDRLPFPDNSFDCLFQIESLSHMEDPPRALGESVRVLRKKGTIYVLDFNNGMNPRMIYRSWKLKHFQNVSEYPVNPFFISAELRNLNVEDIEVAPYIFPSELRGFRKDFWRMMKKRRRMGILFSPGFMLKGRKVS